MLAQLTDKKIAVLAFSGGLDTSYCVLDLLNKGYEVVTAFVDTGTSSHDEVKAIADKALSFGAKKHFNLDASDLLWEEFVVPLLHSGAMYQGQYPLLCSDRYLIVKLCLQLCDEIGTNIFAHGCTAMGNDQVRFDQTVRCLGQYEIIAPIRELQNRGGDIRSFEIEQLQNAGHEVKLEHKRYSINENILGVTWSGSEIDEFQMPAVDAWKLCKPRAEWPEAPYQVELLIKRGRVVAVNGVEMGGRDILNLLNNAFGEYGVGRFIYVGDVVVGLKGRILFECPAITALLTAMRALQEVVMTKHQNQFKHIIAARWAELVYGGFFYEPHKSDLDAYLNSSVESVNGVVTIQTCGGSVSAVSVQSENILQDENSTYAQKAGWSPAEAVGFINLQGMSSALAAKVQQR